MNNLNLNRLLDEFPQDGIYSFENLKTIFDEVTLVKEFNFWIRTDVYRVEAIYKGKRRVVAGIKSHKEVNFYTGKTNSKELFEALMNDLERLENEP